VGHSRRERHRDRDPGRRQAAEDEPPRPDRVFRLTHDQREEIAKSLRYIDAARQALEHQQNADNREIIRELRASANRIFDLLNGLEELA
jgi:DNA-binding PadR family transcriptional regulator